MGETWHRHDAGFFTLDIPPGWLAEQSNTATLLLHGGQGALSMALLTVSKTPNHGGGRTVRRVTAGDAQVELQKWMDSQKHVRVQQSPHIVAGALYPTASSEGVRAVGKGISWYKRLFQRRPGDLWRYWAVLNPHLVVLASCSGPASAMEKARRTVDRLIRSIRLPEREILLGRRFTDMVVSLARSWFPQTQVAVIDDVHLQFGTQNVSLVNLHRRYLASPEELPTQVRAFLSAVQDETPASAMAASWLRARERVVPVLQRSDALAAIPAVAAEEWVNGLSIGYALQSQDAEGTAAASAERAITRADLLRWHIDLDDLQQQALENLVTRSHEHIMEGRKASGYTMLCLAKPDRNNAARLLLPDLHQKLRVHLGGTFMAAIPTRDTLLTFSIRDEDVLAAVRQEVQGEWARAGQRGAAGLSPKLFLVTRDGIAGDPAETDRFEI